MGQELGEMVYYDEFSSKQQCRGACCQDRLTTDTFQCYRRLRWSYS